MSPVKIPYAIEKVILNLSEARNNEHHPIGQMTNIFVRKLQDANAILTVRVGSSSAPEIPLEAGDSFPFDVEFSDLFFTNISGGAGAQAEIIVSKGVSPYRPQIITPDLLTRSLLSTSISVGSTATLLPATALADRRRIIVQNADGGANVYFGDSSVTTVNGQLLKSLGVYDESLSDNVLLYGIVASGTQAVRVLESR